MHILNGHPFDINAAHVIGAVQYPAIWFSDPGRRSALGITEGADSTPIYDSLSQIATEIDPVQINGVWTQQWAVTNKDAGVSAALLQQLKAEKNIAINDWRAAANESHFLYLGKQIACDKLSRSDIDGVAGSIALFGVFPAGFPGAWKAMDNSYVVLSTVDDFKAMYAAMTTQGSFNFGRSQTLKAALAAATTQADIDAIVW